MHRINVATLDAWPGSIPASQATGLAVPDARQHALSSVNPANAQLVPLQLPAQPTAQWVCIDCTLKPPGVHGGCMHSVLCGYTADSVM